MSLYDKAKIHVEVVAYSRSFRFMLYQLLHIINRRHILFPFIQSKLTYVVMFMIDPIALVNEKYLEKYMFPKHNGCFVDVGANVGLWTFFMAKQGVEVHAFEPSPQPRRILRKHMRNFNIHVYPYALGNGDYMANLKLHFISEHNGLVKEYSDFIGYCMKTPVKRLDTLKLRDVGLIKIDTEGYEIPVLLGAKQTILINKPRLIIEIHLPFKEQLQKTKQILTQLNYKWIVGHKTNLQPQIIADSK